MRNKRQFFMLVSVLVLIVLSVVPVAAVNAAPAGDKYYAYGGQDLVGGESGEFKPALAGSCSCVNYIKNRFGLGGSAGSAKNMGPYLAARGFVQVGAPRVGAVVIFQPSHGGVNPSHGHVGVIIKVESVNGNRDWRLTVRGANQWGGRKFTQYNCNNVSDVPFSPYPKSRSTASYWVALPAYKIVSVHSGKVLDVSRWSLDNGARIHQWAYHGGGNQKWCRVYLGNGRYKVVSRWSGKVLDVTGWSRSNGAPIQQWSYHGGRNQQWRFVQVGSYYKIVSVHSGKVLDVTGWSRSNGAQIQQWDYHGGNNQLWRLIPCR